MKIAYVCADPGIPVFGHKGASIHIQEVIQVLLNNGAEVTLFAQRLGGRIPERLARLVIVPLPDLTGATDDDVRARAALDANPALAKLLAEAGPFDVVYERYSLWSYAAMLYASRSRTPSILEVNAPLIEEQRRYRTLPLEQEALRALGIVLDHAATLIAVSDGVKAWLETFPSARGKVHVVENGVDPERFCVRFRPAHAAVNVGFLGTMKPWHGLHTLIHAFILLHQRGCPATLSIIGDGPEYATLYRQLEQHNLLAAARFWGPVAWDKVPERLAEIDIAVAPYPQLDNFYFSPLKIYEYMAAGLPVIASRVGQLDRLVSDGETGLLTAPDDPQALCDAIVTLQNDPVLRQRMGRAGRRRIECAHRWEHRVNDIFSAANVAWRQRDDHGG